MEDAMSQERCQSDELDPARAQALAKTLGLERELTAGASLPPFFHQIYFWDAKAKTELGRDGHPRVGGLIPDMGLPRRMWAGGRLEFTRPLSLGQPAEKRSICTRSERKTGRSGPLALITLRHSYWQNGVDCVTEWQDLVYREEAQPGGAGPTPPRARDDAQSARTVSFSTTQLFRYSALTFNGHRIHYDRDYAATVEGYSGLVVHGPLLAQYLMLLAEQDLGPLSAFSFRATSALMDFEQATLCRQDRTRWVRGPDGRQCMIAEATPVSE